MKKKEYDFERKSELLLKSNKNVYKHLLCRRLKLQINKFLIYK